jgi:hypothetical protein
MVNLADAYDSGQLSSYGGGNVDWWQDYIRAELGRAHDFYAEQIERLTEANAALMAEREMLIKTKREQIERLTAERDAALAKVAQYEQAPVVGWISPTCAELLFSAGQENEDIGLRVSSLKRHDYTPLIRKPEVSP